MTTYGYIRTSKEHTEGVAGMDPEAQALQLRTAGVTAENIYRDLEIRPETPCWEEGFGQ